VFIYEKQSNLIAKYKNKLIDQLINVKYESKLNLSNNIIIKILNFKYITSIHKFCAVTVGL